MKRRTLHTAMVLVTLLLVVIVIALRGTTGLETILHLPANDKLELTWEVEDQGGTLWHYVTVTNPNKEDLDYFLSVTQAYADGNGDEPIEGWQTIEGGRSVQFQFGATYHGEISYVMTIIGNSFGNENDESYYYVWPQPDCVGREYLLNC